MKIIGISFFVNFNYPLEREMTRWKLVRPKPPSHYFNHRNNKMLIHQSTPYNIHYFLEFARPRILIIFQFKQKTLVGVSTKDSFLSTRIKK